MHSETDRSKQRRDPTAPGPHSEKTAPLGLLARKKGLVSRSGTSLPQGLNLDRARGGLELAVVLGLLRQVQALPHAVQGRDVAHAEEVDHGLVGVLLRPAARWRELTGFGLPGRDTRGFPSAEWGSHAFELTRDLGRIPKSPDAYCDTLAQRMKYIPALQVDSHVK